MNPNPEQNYRSVYYNDPVKDDIVKLSGIFNKYEISN